MLRMSRCCSQYGRSAIRSIPFTRVIRLDTGRQISSVAVIGAGESIYLISILTRGPGSRLTDVCLPMYVCIIGQMGTGIAFVAAKVPSSHRNSLKQHIYSSAEISRLLECRRQCTSPRPTFSGERKGTRFHWSVQHLTHG